MKARYRIIAPLMAAGLAGAAPLSVGPAAASAEDKKFSGYSATTTASPVKLEIFEPTIPIPNSPQAEVMFGYTRVVADTSSSRGRASFLWPGDAVGEGSKTIIDNIGIPKEIADPIAAQGYPVQVNSGYPSGPEQEAKQPFPGTVMYSKAVKDKTIAEAGYSSQCELDNNEPEGEGGDGPAPPDLPLPDIPGLPDLPDLPGFPGLAELVAAGEQSSATSSRDSGAAPVSRSFSRAATGSSASSAESAESAEEEESACQIPPQLAALISFGGYAAVSKTESSTQEARSKSRAAVSDVSLFGGVVRFSGVSAEALSTSDGTKPTGKTSATYGTIFIGPEEFAIGPEGVRGGGQGQEIPGLPDEPKAALAELGITVTVPEPVYKQSGQALTSTREGLIVTIDSKTVAAAVRQLPLQDVVAQLPEDMAEFKKVLQAALNLSPKFVVHLAYSSSKINTVQPLDIPPLEVPEAPIDEGGAEEADEGGEASGGTSGVGGTASTGGTAPGVAPSTSSTDGALTDAALASGLPPLFSIPMLLMVLALGGAVVAGSYVRRMGALVLGHGAPCPHGLDSGLPDLRRIQ